MAGVPLQQLTMLLASQGPAWATDAETFVNDVAFNTYTTRHFKAGKEMYETIQGGDFITDTVLLDFTSTWTRYDPNVDIQYTQEQTGDEWVVRWSFAYTQVAWTKQDLKLNRHSMGKKYRTQKYKDVIRRKYQVMWTDACNEIEREMWAVPNRQRMEDVTTTGGPRIPYSLPVINNELDNGVYADAQLGSGNGFTTTQQINGVTKSLWRNQRGFYSFGLSADLSAKMFAAFGSMFRKLRFEQLPKEPQYSDKTTLPTFIATNSQGIAMYEYGLTSNQDLLRGMGSMGGADPAYPGPLYRGVPIEYISLLDTAAIYPTAASDALSDWDDDTNSPGSGQPGNAGPRYHFFNGMYLNYVVHEDNYFDITPPRSPDRQPFSVFQAVDSWNNLVCRSRLRHGTLAPDGDYGSTAIALGA